MSKATDDLADALATNMPLGLKPYRKELRALARAAAAVGAREALEDAAHDVIHAGRVDWKTLPLSGSRIQINRWLRNRAEQHTTDEEQTDER